MRRTVGPISSASRSSSPSWSVPCKIHPFAPLPLIELRAENGDRHLQGSSHHRILPSPSFAKAAGGCGLNNQVLRCIINKNLSIVPIVPSQAHWPWQQEANTIRFISFFAWLLVRWGVDVSIMVASWSWPHGGRQKAFVDWENLSAWDSRELEAMCGRVLDELWQRATYMSAQ